MPRADRKRYRERQGRTRTVRGRQQRYRRRQAATGAGRRAAALSKTPRPQGRRRFLRPEYAQEQAATLIGRQHASRMRRAAATAPVRSCRWSNIAESISPPRGRRHPLKIPGLPEPSPPRPALPQGTRLKTGSIRHESRTLPLSVSQVRRAPGELSVVRPLSPNDAVFFALGRQLPHTAGTGRRRRGADDL